MPSCSALNCSNSSIKGFKIYNFPNDKGDLRRRQVWLSNTNRGDFNPPKRAGLCKEHFESDQFERLIPGKLKWNAIPTVFNNVAPKTPKTIPQPQRKSTRPRKRPRRPDDSDSDETSAGPPVAAPAAVETPIDVVDIELSSLAELGNANLADQESQVTAEKEDMSKDEESTKIHNLQNPREKTPVEEETNVEPVKPSTQRPKRRVRVVENYDDSLLDDDEYQPSNDVSAVTWSEAAIKKALHLRFSCGYNGYSVLREQGLPLPSDDILRRKLENIPFKNGLHIDIFELLQSRVQSLDDHEKKVSLVIDQICIQPSLDYDIRSRSIVGLPTIPENKIKKSVKTSEEEEDEEASHYEDDDENENSADSHDLAMHAIIFTLQGLTTYWRQTVAYELTGNSFKVPDLKLLITSIIRQCFDIKLEVKNVIMDVGDANEDILKEFGITFDNILDISNTIPSPVNPKSKLYFFSSFPNLIKCLKNDLILGQEIFLPESVVLKHNLPTSVVSLNYVQNMLSENEQHELKQAAHLKNSYVHHVHFQKLREVPAVNLFSRDTAAALRLLVARQDLPEEALSTAWFFEQVSIWYNVVTAKVKPVALAQFSVEKLNASVKGLNDFILLILSMNIGSEDAARKNVQKEIFISTTSITMIKNSLFHNGDCMDGFNQNFLESLFSVIRFRNSVPTALELKNTLRLITLSQLLKGSSHGSYTVDPTVNIPISALRHVDVGEAIKLARSFSNKDFTDMHLSELKDHTLYNFCVYCVTQYIRLNENCDTCVNFIVLRGKPAGLLADQLEVNAERCYSPDSHTFASLDVYNFFLVAEQIVLSLQEPIIRCEVVLPQLREQTMEKSEHLAFPDCHLVKEKLLDWYISVRIYSFLTEKIT